MKILKRIAALLTATGLMLFTVMFACAAEIIDQNRRITLTISYNNEDDIPISGAEFSIYMVATADEYGNLTTTEKFSGYNVNIEDGDDDAWKALATTLEGYVLRDQILPTDSKKTDGQGFAYFPNNGVKLRTGLYLVLGTRHSQNGVIYETLPFMILMPTQDPHEKEWNYDVSLSPKYELCSGHITEKVNCKVLKVWNDKGNEDIRPDEVVMQLLKDGKIYDTVTLNSENNWRYQWSDLESTHQWRVVEKELDDYTVEVSREGVAFVITNTCTKETPTEPVPTIEPTTSPDKPNDNPNDNSTNPVTPDNPSNPDTPNNPANPVKPNDSTLPQTGQLWWPVPMLSAAGLLLIVIGLLCLRGKNNEENKS